MRGSLVKARTPSATLPSSSIFAPDSTQLPPVRLDCAFRANGPIPPPGSGCRPPQRIASRSDFPSTASVPSTFKVGRWLMWPSKASLNGAPASRTLRPERSPDSAASRSAALALASNASSRQTNRPVAPKLREIDGQANDNSTSESCSDTPREGSTTVIVPPLTRISENDSTRCACGVPGLSVRASVASRFDQLEWPSGSQPHR